MRKEIPALLISAVVLWTSPCESRAASIYYDRALWESAVDVFWDVDLAGAPNNLTAGDTLGVEAPIQLPPLFNKTLSFDSPLEVEYGTVEDGIGWHNYIAPGGGDPPLVLYATGPLTGTLSDGGFGLRKFGFEVKPVDEDSKITVSLSLDDGTTWFQSESFQASASGAPTFFGWVNEGYGITTFKVSREDADGRFAIGNFVVPEGATTLELMGLVLLALAAMRGRASL